MRRETAGLLVGICLGAALLQGQEPTGPAASFKLGTFELAGRTYVGAVVNDALVIDLEQANAAFEKQSAGTPRLAIPREMKELIATYDDGMRRRIAALVSQAASAQPRPSWVHDVQGVRTRPPVAPTTILNAAVNYVEHAKEMGVEFAREMGMDPPAGGAPTQAELPGSIQGIWERKPADTRHNPYFFLKPTAVVIANGEAIRLPPGRDQIDWECELSVVVGRVATRVPVEQADEYIFGYTLQNDVSDRGGRGDNRHGSDWLIGKGHDTFAPLGPYIVPKEFVADPQKMPIRFTLSGKLMQDSSTDRMTHNVYEMLSFASNILTLHPGDILAMGSPAGVGAASGVFFKPGDVSACSIGNLGTLTNPVVGPTGSTASIGGR